MSITTEGQRTEGRAGHAEEQRLATGLANHSPPACPQGQEHDEIPRARDRSGRDQSGKVAARHKQDEADQRRHQPDPRPHWPDNLVVQ
jgi:hypothetical protein